MASLIALSKDLLDDPALNRYRALGLAVGECLRHAATPQDAASITSLGDLVDCLKQFDAAAGSDTVLARLAAVDRGDFAAARRVIESTSPSSGRDAATLFQLGLVDLEHRIHAFLVGGELECPAPVGTRPVAPQPATEQDGSTEHLQRLHAERAALLTAWRRNPDDASHRAALQAFYQRNPGCDGPFLRGPDVSRRCLVMMLLADRWETEWPAYRDTAREEELDLAGRDPSPIVRALAEQATTENLWQKVAIRAWAVRPIDLERSLLDLSHQMQRRYLSTLRMLAVVRRLERGMDLHVTHHVGAPPAAPKDATVITSRVPEALPTADMPGALPEAAATGGRRNVASREVRKP